MSNYQSGTGGHAGGHVRHAFLEAIDALSSLGVG